MQLESRPAHLLMRRIVVAAALLVAACQQLAPESSSTAADNQHVVAIVDSLTRAFEQAERDLQPGRVRSLLSPDFYMYADGVRANYGEVVTGIDEISTFQHFEPGWDNLEVRALGPDAAMVSFTFRDSIVTGSGDVLLAGGATTLVWERRDGEWRVIYADADHYPVE